jgi:hypothetical protein
MNTNALIRSIAALAERRIDSPEALQVWQVEAAHLKKQLHSHPGAATTLPHFVWHYLDDADLRSRDPQYASSQNEQLHEALASMGKGNAV